MGVRRAILPVIISTLIFAALGFSFEAFAENPNDQVPSEPHVADTLIIQFIPISEESNGKIIWTGEKYKLEELSNLT